MEIGILAGVGTPTPLALWGNQWIWHIRHQDREPGHNAGESGLIWQGGECLMGFLELRQRKEQASRLGEPRVWCDGAISFAAPLLPAPATRGLCALQNVAVLSSSPRTPAAVSATSGLQPPTPCPWGPRRRLRLAWTPAAVSASSGLQPPSLRAAGSSFATPSVFACPRI